MIAGNTRRRQIGGIGTAARVVLGLALLALGVTGGRVSVMNGQVGIGFEPISVVVGVVGFPAVVLALQWLRARVVPTRLGCEVTAISNSILGRDDQVGCLVLSPVDDLERRLTGSSNAGQSVASPTKPFDGGPGRD